MKSSFYITILFTIIGLSACNSSEPEQPKPAAEKPTVIQEAEKVEAILQEKAEADKKLIDETGH